MSGKADGYESDETLRGIYKLADELDTEGLQILCPGYTELAAVENRYTEKSLLGKGALKEVYRCFDERTKRFIALARPREDLGADCYDDFVHEAWLISTLKHPNIIKVHDAGVDAGGRPFFTMDLKGNTTLNDLVVKSPARRELLVIFIKICDAVAYAHSQGIIHRDLKPENIQCDQFGEVLVCDWGLGKFIYEEELEMAGVPGEWSADRNLTSHGHIKGSLGYMAPEQILPDDVIDERSDVFALGCVLHFILTEKAPFTGSKDEILDGTTGSARQSLRKTYPTRRIPKGLDAVTLKAIARDPQQRYETVTQLQADIYRHLAGRSTSAEPPSVLRRGSLFVKRNKLPFGIAAAAVVILGVSGWVFVKSLEQKDREAEQAKELSLLLSSEIDDLSAEYDELVTQTEEPRRELAERLVIKAMQRKKAVVFTEPKVPFREVNRLIAKALQLDPDSSEAQFQHFSNHCIMLDFVGAMKHPLNSEHKFPGYIKYAEAFPEYDFSETKRPDINELTRFFRKAGEMGDGHAPLMTAILAYDSDSRSDKNRYPQVVGAAFEYLWPENVEVITEYSPGLDQLTVKSEKGDFVDKGKVRGATMMLRFLEVDTLTVQTAGKFDLSCLSQATVRRLDLSGLQKPILPERLLVSGLEEVLIHKNQSGQRWLSRLLTTDGLSRPKVIIADE